MYHKDFTYHGESERGRVRLVRPGPNEWSREVRGVDNEEWWEWWVKLLLMDIQHLESG